VAMVPEGLVLLTSVAFAVGVVRLARRKTLVQELAAVETLARVDVICVDKTGTLTTGEISVDDVDHLQEQGENISALGALAAVDPNPNATLLAVREAWPVAPWDPQEVVPFSSARKWSAARFEDHGTWVIGAPEILVASIDETASAQIRRKIEAHATTGRRVLLLARSAPIVDETLQGAIEPRAIVTLVDRMRPDAAATIAYSMHKGWQSRSSPATIRARPPRSQRALASRMPPTPWMPATSKTTRGVLGKRSSETPCSAASLRIRREQWSKGRRVINNIERVANLFLTKTIYSMILALAIAAASLPFPFLPRHLTLIGSLTIGIPAFFLALVPNRERARSGFVDRVLRFAIPVGVLAASATFVGYYVALQRDDVSLDESRTTATIILMSLGLLVFADLAGTLGVWRVRLVGAMVALFLAVLLVPPFTRFFAVEMPPPMVAGIIAVVVAVTYPLMHLSRDLVARRVEARRVRSVEAGRTTGRVVD